MKEIKDIINAFDRAHKQNKKVALATIVHVEGSSYRRPGARMLITDDGEITGAISGGCLEGDALKKALLAINQQQNKLVTYDTTDDDDLKFGVQLGCNGIVHILFEPIDDDQKNDPLSLLRQLLLQTTDAVLVTFFSLNKSFQPGTGLLYKDGFVQNNLSHVFEDEIINDVQAVFYKKSSSFISFKNNQQRLNAFIEFIAPPVSIVIVGAGNDAQPLVNMASLLGWNITVADGRQTHATQQRFPKADKVFLTKPLDILCHIKVHEYTAFILMTHNFNYDIAVLELLLTEDCNYIGVLGPRKRFYRMLDVLNNKGVVLPDEKIRKIYGPVGLDIGAETSEEIALSIIAEIKAVFSKRKGTSLKDRSAEIHERSLISQHE